MSEKDTDREEAGMRSKAEEARRERLIEVRVERGFRSASAAADHYRFAGSSYRSHENGQRPIKEDTARVYALAYRIHYDWLYHGRGERDLPATSAVISPPTIPLSGYENDRRLNILGRAKGGSGGAIILDGAASGTVRCPPMLRDVFEAYALEVTGTSMEPRYSPGEIVYVNPIRPYHAGSYVVLQVRNDDGELYGYIKRYKRHTEDKVVCCQFKPEGEVEYDLEAVEAIHLIVQAGLR